MLSRETCLIAPQDVQTGRLLVMKRSTLQSREGRAVYEKEASTMRSIAHPNIVQVRLLSIWEPYYRPKTRVMVSSGSVLSIGFPPAG